MPAIDLVHALTVRLRPWLLVVVEPSPAVEIRYDDDGEPIMDEGMRLADVWLLECLCLWLADSPC